MDKASCILIVDDERDGREILLDALTPQGYSLLMAADSFEALDLAKKHTPDLILLDVMMPGLDGFEVCQRLRAQESTAIIPIVMVTALDDRQSRIRGLSAGADDFLSKPIDRLELQVRVRTITRINRYRLLLEERKHSEEQALQAARDIERAYDATIAGWSQALDLRDHETEGHSLRVAELTVRLARLLGIGEAEIMHIRRGALLHDIGKLGIPDSILHKPGPLSDEEWKIMRMHPVYAHEWLSPIEFLRPALDIPHYHHERWDGSGYPSGLKGEEIPLAARIFSVIDVWDALRSDRPYRDAWPIEKVQAHIRDLRGKHFDPQVVEAFFTIDLEI